MTFDACTKSALARYKRQTLAVHEDGLWNNKRPYPHILPEAMQQLNILPHLREPFWQYWHTSEIKLHDGFHHLNSSQALCFNLFFPFLHWPDVMPDLVHALSLKGEAASGALFEFVPDPVEQTSIDFMLPLSTGARVIFEVKYTEADFASVSPKLKKYREKFANTYQPRFDGRVHPDFETLDSFCGHYQIMRNIWHLRPGSGDTVVFLVPRANVSLHRSSLVIRNCASAEYKNQIRLVFLEDLVDSLERLSNAYAANLDYVSTLADFRRKYLHV